MHDEFGISLFATLNQLNIKPKCQLEKGVASYIYAECPHVQVYLVEEDGRGCIFKILPRYKVQSVGEEVHYSDQVKLESVATEGQFLHCSQKTFGEVQININKDWLAQSLTLIYTTLKCMKMYAMIMYMLSYVQCV